MTQLNWPTLAEEISRGTVRDPLQHFRTRQKRDCPLCGFTGYFLSAGPRQEARCPNCASKERDRIIALYLKRANLDPNDKRVLHFSAERPFFHQWKRNPKYVAGDIKPSAVANAVVDITALTYPDNEFDVIVCNHVLEHVQEDAKGHGRMLPGDEAGRRRHFLSADGCERRRDVEPAAGHAAS
ncbi:MAG: methyltransferase domain-containing protein [Caulobacteraceae bacterium]|nr:methyltransferase domain-containing protein [Caulobacteraceae bacterium]